MDDNQLSSKKIYFIIQEKFLINFFFYKESIFSYHLRANATVLCLNCHGNRLIAAGQQSKPKRISI